VRLHEKDTLEMGRRATINVSGYLPEDALRLGSTCQDDCRVGSNEDVLGDLQNPDGIFSVLPVEGVTVGEVSIGTPLVESGFQCLALKVTTVELNLRRPSATGSITERGLHVRHRGSEDGRRGGCPVGGEHVAGHQRACRVGGFVMNQVKACNSSLIDGAHPQVANHRGHAEARRTERVTD